MSDKETIVAAEQTERYFPKPKTKRRLWIPAVIAAVVIAAAGALTYAVYGYDRIYPNVGVDGLDLGNMSKTQAASVIQKQFSDKYTNKSIKLSVLDKEYLLGADEFGFSVDSAKTAQNALNYGRNGNIFDRSAAVIGLFFAEQKAELEYNFNETKIKELVDTAANNANTDKEEYFYGITGTHLIIDNAKTGITLDRDELFSEIVARFESFDFSDMNYLPRLDEPQPLNLDNIHTQIKTLPVNAYFDKDSKEIIPEKPGISFNVEQAKIALNTDDLKIFVPLIKTMPEITAQSLDEKLFKDTLAEYKSYLNPGNRNRTNNVRLAANSINNTILAPGDIFSYNEIVGQRTEARGFKDAFVYIAGEVVEDIGGGICQVSSTIYAAVLHANLKIIERQNHAFSVTYVPLGLDATVYWGSLDFRFQNDTNYPIKIIAVQKDNYVYIQLLGTKENDLRVEMKTKTLSFSQFGEKIIEDPNLPYGTKKVTVEGHSASVVEAYKIIYDGNGEIISNTLESRNSYKKLDQTTVIGTLGRPDDAPADPGTPAETLPEVIPAEPVPPENNPETPPVLPAEPEEVPETPPAAAPPTTEPTAVPLI